MGLQGYLKNKVFKVRLWVEYNPKNFRSTSMLVR